MSTKRIIYENGVYWEINGYTSKRLSDKKKMPIINNGGVMPTHHLTVAYIGSATNVIPVHQYPEHNFVFVTPEPSHPVAITHWPEGCVGWRQLMQSREQFLDIILACLGRSRWSMQIIDSTLAVFTHILPTHQSVDGPDRHQTLRVFSGMSSDDMEDRTRAEVLSADHFILGFNGEAGKRARRDLFDHSGTTATELLDPSDDSELGRGGEFEPLQGSPYGVGQEWTWVPYTLDNTGDWIPAASDTIMRAHPGPIVISPCH